MKIIYSEQEKKHHPLYEFSEGKMKKYPEKSFRAELIRKEIEKRGMGSLIIQPGSYPIKHIKKVHDAEMVDFVKSCEELDDGESVFPHVFPYTDHKPDFRHHPQINLQKAGYYCFDVGIQIQNQTFEAARAAVDCALTGADLIKNKKERHVFSLCRPPGHHAGYNFFGGYCIFNNAAAAAAQLMNSGKVAILDVDFHHGNGTQNIFYEIPDVLYVSVHGNPEFNFPFLSGFPHEKGSKLGIGSTYNIPMKKGAGDKEHREYLAKAIKKVDSFKPDVLILSLGLDIYEEDPLSDIGVSSDYFKEIAQVVSQLGIPVLALLEGGYDIKHLNVNGANFAEGMGNL